MLDLRDRVTLACLDTKYHAASRKALEACLDRAQFDLTLTSVYSVWLFMPRF